MKAYFRIVFKEILDKIQNPEIREKVLQAWTLAAEENGWKKTEELENMPFTLLTETNGINIIQHTIAVTKGAVGLAKAITETYEVPWFDLKWDVLYAGGLLHDVGKLNEIELKDGKYIKSYAGKCARHPISGAMIAAKVGLPADIINTIANHAKEGDGRPKRIETILIHQADFATFDPMVMLKEGTLIV